MALGVVFAEGKTAQIIKPDSGSLDTTRQVVSGYPTYATVESESVFVEIPKPEVNFNKPKVLEMACPVCDSCYPIDLGVGMCTAVYSPNPCVNSCGFRFQCRRTDEEFTIQMNECDRIKWGFWKRSEE
ncbi:MAG: hypothetical protein G01um101420_358 [Parcubacteria group bacterium Gr01-1014_20]|nr:MAG: hypothetical protein G01um101420_358 [Parcubacteria group bacterium Gr01-1014_20]